MKKSTTWTIIIVILIVLGIILISVPKQKAPETAVPESEEVKEVSQLGEKEEAEEIIKTLTVLPIPRVGDEPPSEEVGAPGKIAVGEKDKPDQEYWVFETELKNSKLDPYEFRIPLNDLFGLSVTNSEDQDHTVYISSESSFAPNFIQRIISPGKSSSIRTQVLKLGIYDIKCSTCDEEVIGQFVVVPKK